MTLLERLEANSMWIPMAGCRVWLGALSRDHGVVKVAGKPELVHRVAWTMERGPIPKGLWVLHSCGVGPCFNVEHLRLGTREENAGDRAAHGGYRGAVGGGLRSNEWVSDDGVRRPPLTKTPPLDHAELQRILSYDPDTGVFRHRTRSDRDYSWNARFAGEIAGGVVSLGYRHINMNGQHHYAHRLAWFYVTGAWPVGQVDHINGDRDDNRWANLRLATNAQNQANSKVRSTNTSGVKGVSWDKKKRMWVAMITKERRQRFLGYFRSIEEAAAARRAAETEHHGEYARKELN